MCTLVIAWQAFADAPVVVAANRDEAIDRPSRPPERIDGSPAIVAPRDERAGGSWFGYNDRGLFVGLSNRWTDPDLSGERSRGLLVMDLLRTVSTAAATDRLEAAVVTDRYAPFNLVLADGETAVVYEWDGALRVTELSPGVHAVLNAGWDDRFVSVSNREEDGANQAESARQLRETLAVLDDESPDGWLDRAAAALADHEFGVCIHRNGFGTRSSSLLSLRRTDPPSYRFADGPPCRTAFRTVEAQI